MRILVVEDEHKLASVLKRGLEEHRYAVDVANRVLTRTQIAEHVWDYDFVSMSNVIDVYVGYLRRKLADDVRRDCYAPSAAPAISSRRHESPCRRRTVAQVPRPGRLLTVMWPPCAVTSAWAIDRPRPAPPVARERARSTR